VNHVDPTLVVTGAATANVGATYSLTLGSTSPGAETIQTWLIDWNGDGSDLQTVNGPSPALSHVYTDDGTFTIGITAINPYGVYTASKVVAIAHVAPTLTNLATVPTPSVLEGNVSQLSGIIVDPNVNDTHVLTVDWGDGGTNTYNYGLGVTGF